MKPVYIVFAKNESDEHNEVVGVYTTADAASKRLSDFQFGYILQYTLDRDIPY